MNISHIFIYNESDSKELKQTIVNKLMPYLFCELSVKINTNQIYYP